MPDDLKSRLQQTRNIPIPWGEDATRGITSQRLSPLLTYWQTDFDWARHDRRIRAYPWVTVPTATGDLQLIDQHCADPDSPTVVLLHGWPDSVLRFERLLPLLTDMRVIVPALPGFPFAAPLTKPGMSANVVAEMVAAGLGELGCTRYTLSGGDVGGAVAEIIAAEHPDRVRSLHLTNIAPQRALQMNPDGLPSEEAVYVRQRAQWFQKEGGYIAIQSTRPNTLAVALGDSPAGLAAWITEKLDSWSDPSAFTNDELLTWITAYWVTHTIATSFAMYTEPATLPERINAPTVISAFANDRPAPRSYIERFLNMHAYLEHPTGGHFAAWEEPAVYAQHLRRAVALLP